MNTAMLHVVTEDLASFVDEVTDDVLGLPTPCTGWTVGDLCRHLVEENGRFGHAVSGRPVPHDATHGAGFAETYRNSARYMQAAFDEVAEPQQSRQVEGVVGARPISELLGMQIADTLIHTWDLSSSLDLGYMPRPDIAELVLQGMRAVPAAARGEGRAFAAVREVPDADRLSTLDRLLLLSGRDIGWRPAGAAAQAGAAEAARSES